MHKAPATELPVRTALSGGREPAPSALVVIGGLLTIKQLSPLYMPLLKLDKTSSGPAHKRFVPPPQRGLGTVEGMTAELNTTLLRIHEQHGRKLDLVGHSLGALMAMLATLENPDIVASATFVGGAHAGIKKETAATTALRRAVGNPPEAALLQHDSGFMNEQHARVANDWPADVPMYIYATVLDELIVPPQGFGLRPQGHAPADMGLVAPRIPGLQLLARRMLRDAPPEVKTISTLYPAEHINLVRCPEILGRIALHRAGMPADCMPETGATPLQPLAVPAAG
jgi:pimeloyl-ACP methyl ester carboxylesterase